MLFYQSVCLHKGAEYDGLAMKNLQESAEVGEKFFVAACYLFVSRWWLHVIFLWVGGGSIHIYSLAVFSILCVMAKIWQTTIASPM